MIDHQVFDIGDSERERMLAKIAELQRELAELRQPLMTFPGVNEDRLVAALAAAGDRPIKASQLLPLAQANLAARRELARRMADQAMQIQTLMGDLARAHRDHPEHHQAQIAEDVRLAIAAELPKERP